MLKETHYYPFGLTMAGISSKAAGKLENKKNKFQGQEYNDDLGLNMYEFRYRLDDPQIGRFAQIDPLSSKYVHNSTYAFAENKVTMGIDLEGLELLPFNSAWFRSASQNKGPNGQMVKVNPSNVPTIFKDATGNPLFSASSVSVGPNGRISTGNQKGAQLRSGNNLPKSPSWAWSQDAQPTASTSGGQVGNNLDNNQAFADRTLSAASAPQEVQSWWSTFKSGGNKDIWEAYGGLSTNINSFDNANKLVGSHPFGMLSTPEMRGDLVNFINDGTVPLIDFGNLKQSVQNGFNLMQTGIEIMNKNGIAVRESTNETFKLYTQLMQIINSVQKPN